MKDEEFINLTDEQGEKLRQKFYHDLERLCCFIRSMDYGMVELKILLTLFIATLCKCDKLDEEDIRGMFRGVNTLKDRIIFK